MRGYIKNICIFAVCITIIIGVTACGKQDSEIIGTWIVDYYKTSEEDIPADKIVEYYGENFAEYNDTKFIFQSSNTVEVSSPLQNTTVHFTVSDGIIELSDNDKQLMNLEISGNNIILDYNEKISIVFKKE